MEGTVVTTSGGASAVKEPGHFEVRKSSSQVTWMHFFLQTFLFFVHTITEAKQHAGRSQGFSQGGGSSSQII